MLNFTDRARKGIGKIRRSGDAGKIKQLEKALTHLVVDPAYPSLQSHRMKKPNRYGDRDDLWISYIRLGPGGERIIWSYGDTEAEQVQILDIEDVTAHIDR